MHFSLLICKIVAHCKNNIICLIVLRLLFQIIIKNLDLIMKGKINMNDDNKIRVQIKFHKQITDSIYEFVYLFFFNREF